MRVFSSNDFQGHAMPNELQKPEFSDLAEIVRSAELRRTDELVGWFRLLAKKPSAPGKSPEAPYISDVAPAR